MHSVKKPVSYVPVVVALARSVLIIIIFLLLSCCYKYPETDFIVNGDVR